MPLNVRHIATNFAVITFFALGFVCWVSGLSPFTCCKRAGGGAAIAFIAAVIAVKVINAIIINALIDFNINKQKEDTSDNTN